MTNLFRRRNGNHVISVKSMTNKSLLCLTMFVFGLGTPILNAEDTLAPLKEGLAPQTHAELWADYDPRAEPLDVEVLKAVLKVLRYRIGIFKGQKAMMAGVYGYPKGRKNLPGLVQIHGGGQYADYRDIRCGVSSEDRSDWIRIGEL